MKKIAFAASLTAFICIGCSSASPTPVTPTETPQRTELISFRIPGQEVAPYTYDKVSTPVEITITTRQADSVTLYSRSTGEGERVEIMTLTPPPSENENAEQTTQYSWTPPKDAVSQFIWAEAKGHSGTSISPTYRLRFQQ